jgi:hypothetical protein
VTRRKNYADFQSAQLVTRKIDAGWFKPRKSTIDPVLEEIMEEAFRRVLND